MPSSFTTRLVLLDRDGTINVEKNYLSSPEQLELLPHSAAGIKQLRQLGLIPVVVSNQSGIGRGYFALATLEQIHARLNELLNDQDAPLAAIYFCPHTPADKCACRKPAPELAQRAARDFNADLARSFMIGDNHSDIELGQRVGAITILVRTGYGARIEAERKVQPDYVADDLLDAARIIKDVLAGEARGQRIN